MGNKEKIKFYDVKTGEEPVKTYNVDGTEYKPSFKDRITSLVDKAEENMTENKKKIDNNLQKKVTKAQKDLDAGKISKTKYNAITGMAAAISAGIEYMAPSDIEQAALNVAPFALGKVANTVKNAVRVSKAKKAAKAADELENVIKEGKRAEQLEKNKSKLAEVVRKQKKDKESADHIEYLRNLEPYDTAVARKKKIRDAMKQDTKVNTDNILKLDDAS